MANLQEIFNRVRETRRKQADVKQVYKDALQNSAEYVEISEKLKTLREKKKQLEASIKRQFSSELEKLEHYAQDLKSDAELLSDAAMNMLLKGERVEVQDEYHNTYDPVIVVRFKKAL